MPWKPKRPCRHPGCCAVSDELYCAAHRKQYAPARGSSSEQGYGYRWRKARLRYLKLILPEVVKCLQMKG